MIWLQSIPPPARIGDGVMGRDQNQPVRPVEIQRELPLPVAFQLVKPAGSVAQVLQDDRRANRVQTAADQLRPVLAVRFPQELEIVTFLLELRGLKADFQGARSLEKSFTY